MSNRAAQATSRETARLISQQLDNGISKLEILHEEDEHASTNLVSLPGELLTAEKQTDSALKAWEQSKEVRQRAETDAVGSFANTPEDRARRLLLNYQVVAATISQDNAEVNWIFHELKRSLAAYLDGSLVSSNGLLRKQLDDLQARLEQIQTRIETWKANSDQEISRSGADVSRLSAEDNADRALLQLHENRYRQAKEGLVLVNQLDQRVYLANALANQLDQEIFLRSSSWEQIWNTVTSAVGSVWGVLGIGLTYRLFTIGATTITPLAILRLFLILIGASWASRLLRRGLEQIADTRVGVTESTFYTLGRLIHYTVLGIGIVIALVSIGLDFSSLAIVAGALSVGIGFGLQSIVINFLSGLIILFERNLQIGDFIELESGFRGRVQQIKVQNTIIRTNDGIDVVIPNSEITSNRLINWTMQDTYRRVHVPFSVAYGTDKEQVRELIVEMAKNLSCTLKGKPRYGEPQVRIVQFGESSLDFELVVWVDTFASTRDRGTISRYLWEIETTLTANNIEIPFPQRDLHVKSIPDEITKHWHP